MQGGAMWCLSIRLVGMLAVLVSFAVLKPAVGAESGARPVSFFECLSGGAGDFRILLRDESGGALEGGQVRRVEVLAERDACLAGRVAEGAAVEVVASSEGGVSWVEIQSQELSLEVARAGLEDAVVGVLANDRDGGVFWGVGSLERLGASWPIIQMSRVFEVNCWVPTWGASNSAICAVVPEGRQFNVLRDWVRVPGEGGRVALGLLIPGRYRLVWADELGFIGSQDVLVSPDGELDVMAESVRTPVELLETRVLVSMPAEPGVPRVRRGAMQVAWLDAPFAVQPVDVEWVLDDGVWVGSGVVRSRGRAMGVLGPRSRGGQFAVIGLYEEFCFGGGEVEVVLEGFRWGGGRRFGVDVPASLYTSSLRIAVQGADGCIYGTEPFRLLGDRAVVRFLAPEGAAFNWWVYDASGVWRVGDQGDLLRAGEGGGLLVRWSPGGRCSLRGRVCADRPGLWVPGVRSSAWLEGVVFTSPELGLLESGEGGWFSWQGCDPLGAVDFSSDASGVGGSWLDGIYNYAGLEILLVE